MTILYEFDPDLYTVGTSPMSSTRTGKTSFHQREVQGNMADTAGYVHSGPMSHFISSDFALPGKKHSLSIEVKRATEAADNGWCKNELSVDEATRYQLDYFNDIPKTGTTEWISYAFRTVSPIPNGDAWSLDPAYYVGGRQYFQSVGHGHRNIGNKANGPGFNIGLGNKSSTDGPYLHSGTISATTGTTAGGYGEKFQNNKIYYVEAFTKWSGGTDGAHQLWINGVKVFDYHGKTMEPAYAPIQHRWGFYAGTNVPYRRRVYLFGLRVGDANESQSSMTFAGSQPIPGVPAEPTGLRTSVSVGSSNKPRVAVSCDPVPNLISGDGYQVYRDGTMIVGDNPPLPTPSYTDADAALDFGQTHTWRMSAGQSGRYGPWTDPGSTVTLTTPSDTTPPAAPGRPSVTAQTSTSVTLDWPDNSEADLDHYIIERATGTGGTFAALTTMTVSLYNDTTVTAPNTYVYRIKAVDKSGNASSASQTVTVDVTAAIPTTPTGLSVSTAIAHQATLSWNAVSGAKGYRVVRNGTVIADGVQTTNYVDKVDPGDYLYQVATGTPPNLSPLTTSVAATVYGIKALPLGVTLPSVKTGTTTTISSVIAITGRGLWSVSDDAPWLVASPSSGVLSDTPTNVVLTADPTGLPEGSFSAQLAFVESPPATPIPINLTVPTITGSAVQGQTLTGGDGTWNGSPTSFSRKWYRVSSLGVKTVVGTGTTYTLVAGDVGNTIQLGVVATNSGGSSNEALSTATATVAAPPTAPVNTGLPTITGSAVQGGSLSGSMGTWSQSPTTYTWKWQHETSAGSGTYADIAGATGTSSGASASYTIVAGDVGLKIRFVVTATNATGSTTANSAATSAVTSSGGSVQLARFALVLDGVDDKILLANSADVSEPLTVGGLIYLTPNSARASQSYHAFGMPAPSFQPQRSIYVEEAGDHAGWFDNAMGGSRGATGFPEATWVWLIASRNSNAAETGGRFRCQFCVLSTGVWSAVYDNVNAGWTFSPAPSDTFVIGGITRTDVATAWIGRWLAGFRANAFYTDAQQKATVSSSGGIFYIDPAVLAAAPSAVNVWRGDNPSQPIPDIKGSASELSTGGRFGSPATYDAGSAILPLKVN